jgi:hypothetical protein
MITAGLLTTISATVFAQDFTDEQQQKMGDAYGQVQGFIATMDHMKGQCGAGAGDITAVWKARNSVPLSQADTMWRRYIVWAAKKSAVSTDQVEAALRDLMKPMLDGVTNSFAKFDSAPPDSKASVCKNFVTAVNAGEWDVKAKTPSVYEFLASQDK